MAELPTLQRVDYDFTLEVVSPLHLGSGRERDDLLPPVPHPQGGERSLLVSAILRNANNLPYIPGSAIKGALRASARECEEPLFGAIRGAAGGGRMGALLVRGAQQIAAGDATGLPCADNGVYVAARTALDPGLGISDPNKLFHAEMVAPGARFMARLRLETRRDVDQLERALLVIFSTWSAVAGVSIGADSASGLGRVRIDGPVRRTAWSTNAVGALVSEPVVTVGLEPVHPVPADWMLVLRCPGPFLTRDPAWNEAARDAAKMTSADTEPPHLRALRRGDVPFLTGQAVSGALRARLAWLCAVDTLRDAGKAPTAPPKRIRDGSKAAMLPPPERLFGLSGWRGVLEVAVEKVDRKASATTTSVRIDRFSAGTIDNALFSTDADLGIQAELRLTLDRRAEDRDRDELHRLVDDLTRNGLTLGHGTNRGFGWFTVEARR